MELYKKYRPTDLSRIVGQEKAVKLIDKLLKNKGGVPHFLLFTGASGCGKTTAARILKDKLDGHMIEINAADEGGVTSIRTLLQYYEQPAIDGRKRIYFLDEAHKLSKAAQELLLKPTEDTPKDVYFFFSTTEKAKLIPTLLSRATEIPFVPVKESSLAKLVLSVAKREGFAVSEEVTELIAKNANGNARKALVLLDSIKSVPNEQEQLEIVEQKDVNSYGIEIARILMNPNCKWSQIAEKLKTCVDEPETVRRIILGYANSVMLNRPSERLAIIIEAFATNYYDSGKAGLTLSCFAVTKN